MAVGLCKWTLMEQLRDTCIVCLCPLIFGFLPAALGVYVNYIFVVSLDVLMNPSTFFNLFLICFYSLVPRASLASTR